MTAFLLMGVLTVVMGALFLFRPRAIIHLSEFMNRIVTTDSEALKYRITMGLILLMFGIFFFFMAYYLYQMQIPV
ncbi:MAG TPA: hypothetical protein PLI51_08520 [bacterium]|nr:hypothetical protein [bacterium]HPQ66754.1 hypothetical protein [bacterium]